MVERGARRRQRVVRSAVGRDVEMGEEIVPVSTVEDDHGQPVVLLDLGEQRIELDGHHRVDEVDRRVVEGHSP